MPLRSLVLIGVALLSACSALTPLTVDEYPLNGQHVRYYLTDFVVGHARTADGMIGIFAIGRATMSDVGRLDLYVYGLAESPVNVEMLEVRVIGSKPEVPTEDRSFSLSRPDRKQIIPSKFSMSSYAPGWPIAIATSVNGKEERLELSLQRRRAESYIAATQLDANVPLDAIEFEQL